MTGSYLNHMSKIDEGRSVTPITMSPVNLGFCVYVYIY